MLALELDELDRPIPDDAIPDEVEVKADSLKQALELASDTMKTDIGNLDYEIIEKGSKGFAGIGRLPYIVKITKMDDNNDLDRFSDIADLGVSLNDGLITQNAFNNEEENRDGKYHLRLFKDGTFISITAPIGTGSPVNVDYLIDKVNQRGVAQFDSKILKKAVEEKSNEAIKVGEWIPKPNADSTLTVEVSPDEMKAFITVSAPRPGGRNLKVEDVHKALKISGVIFGYDDEEIQKNLDSDAYNQPFLAAKGEEAVDGDDAYIDYKVRIDKKVEFKENDSGQVDFLAKDLVENVVQGQVLAILVKEKKGIQGRTVKNKYLPATNGEPTKLTPGKGTILSDKGDQLIAEKNGQVVFKSGKIKIEEIYTVGGDVGLDTGNINFLGSVVIRGSITDNMVVKAAGNIEIGGNVQKSKIEAEGDIIIKQGVQGRDGAHIETTTGSVFSKFIQNAHISVEKDVVVSEAIMHSKIEAGGKVSCLTGKRAQIVGGEVMAGEELRVKNLGAQANTETVITVGTNPKILNQIRQMDKIETNAKEKLETIEQNIVTLNKQKIQQKDKFPSEKEDTLVKMTSAKEKLEERLKEAESEKEQLKEYMEMLANNGKVHVEKTLYPGVIIEINNARFEAKDEYNSVTLLEEKGYIKILPYEEQKEKKKDWRTRRKR